MAKQDPSIRPVWRDIRDGAPPPAFFDLARRALADAHQNLVPRMKPIDVLMLVGEAIAAKFFYPAVERKGPPNFFAYLHHDISAVHALLVADPSYADKAGILWAPKEDDQRYAVECALHSWINDVFTPANGGPWCANPDHSSRGLAIRRQSQLIFDEFFKPDHVKIVERLTDAVVNNVGGSERNPEDREAMDTNVMRGWFKFVGDISETYVETLVFEDERLVMSPRATRRVLARASPRGRHRAGKVRSIDEENRGGSTIADTVESHREADPGDVVSLRDLRDFRDLADLKRTHPLLDQLAERVEGDPNRGGDVGEMLRLLVPVLDRLSDPALRAAVVYALGASEGGGWGVWSREVVADAYGVTVRQLEGRSEQGMAIARRTIVA